jgi:bifunctional non-homologous end joining protein LigD
MLARLADRLPVGGDWTYEVKWDGYRTLAAKDADGVTLWSRNLKDATRQFPGVARDVGRVRAGRALLDGEVVALDDEGRPSFQSLHHQSATTIVYCAFDLLHLDGRDLLRAPLDERRALLSRVVDGSPVLLSATLPGTPQQIERAVRALQLEGVVAKRAASIYQPGARAQTWIKVKFNRRESFVVGGFTPHGTGFESLLVGHRQGSSLLFAGKVRAGLTPRLRAEVMQMIAPLATPRCPFANLPSSRTGRWGEGITAEDMAGLRWVRPRVSVEVSFVEWTRDGLLRHPQFVSVATE